MATRQRVGHARELFRLQQANRREPVLREGRGCQEPRLAETGSHVRAIKLQCGAGGEPDDEERDHRLEQNESPPNG